MAGFADGFKDGFGMVGQLKDRQLKKDQLEKAQSNADRTFGLEERKLEQTGSYNAGQLELKRGEAKTKSELDRIRLSTAKVNAETAQITAGTAEAKQARLDNPESPESQKIQADIASSKAATEKSQAETGKTVEGTLLAKTNRESQEAALRADWVLKLSEGYSAGSVDEQNSTDTQVAQINENIELNKGTRFDLLDISSTVKAEGRAETAQFFQDFAAGMNPSPSNRVMQSLSDTLGVNKSKSLGREITEEFTNAPEWMQGMRVKSQGLWDVKAGREGNLSGTMFVFVENEKGEEFPYFPPLTQSRTMSDSKALNLTLDESMQAVAAQHHMIRAIGPAVRPRVKQARIRALYGNYEGDNGEESFQTKVSAIAETNRKAIMGGDNTVNLFQVSQDMASLPAGTELDATQMAKMRRNIEEGLLFNVDAKPAQDRVQAWIEQTTPILKSAPVPFAVKGSGKETLGELIPEEKWSPQLLSMLNGYYDEVKNPKTGAVETVITDPDALVKVLKKTGWMQ